MIRLSRLADYGVVLAGSMAANPERFYNAYELAATTHLPVPTVSKILAALTRHGVLTSQRGAKGGYRLARSPAEVSVADVVAAVDGPISLTLCADHGESNCDVESVCPNRRGWQRINTAIRKAFQDVSLADMFGSPFLTDAERLQTPRRVIDSAAPGA